MIRKTILLLLALSLSASSNACIEIFKVFIHEDHLTLDDKKVSDIEDLFKVEGLLQVSVNDCSSKGLETLLELMARQKDRTINWKYLTGKGDECDE